MKCQVCGGDMRALVTDLPFKTRENAIVILKELPVLQCVNCQEYIIEDVVMARVESILNKAGSTAELEVVRFAA
jgi:YgiT-type zinc finger domain-containing protein